MRTYHIALNGRTIYSSVYKADADFTQLRGSILRLNAHHITPFCIDRLVNLCDAIRDLKVGDSLYFILSRYEVYHAPSLERINRRISDWEKFAWDKDSVNGENYMPIPHSAYVVKRTPKRWCLERLDYDIDGQISDL